MRIVIDARYLSAKPSGIGVYSQCLLERLIAIDRENEYVVLVHSSYDGTLGTAQNLRLVRHNARPLSLNTVLQLHAVIERLEPDLFHALCPVTPIFYRGKTVVTVHDLQPLQMSEWTGDRPWPVKKAYDLFYRWMYGGTFRRAQALVTVSEATRDALTRMYPATRSKTFAAPSGLPPAAAEAPPPDACEKLRVAHDLRAPYVLFIGSTRPNKNVPRMLRAFARLRRSNARHRSLLFVLVLAKDRFFRAIEQTIESEQLADVVRVVEGIGEDEKRALYRNARALFFVTRYEGFGFPVLEAQAQGTPVVASNCDALPEILRDSALLADPDNPEEMSAALARVLENEALRDDLVQKGFKNLERFSWEAAARSVLTTYQRVRETHL